jgi:hypothetical protein
MSTYEVVRPGSSFNQFGPTLDTCLGKFKTYEKARSFLDKKDGPLKLIEVNNGVRTTIDFCLA